MNDLEPTFYLKDLLDVDPLENDVFLGHRLSLSTGRVFGGQVLAQALMAASKTVDTTKQMHSCHNYFIRPGNSDLPIHYHVYRDLDGRKFSNRRVVAMQNDKPVFSLTASFQAQTEGYAHQIEMPEMPSPEELLNENQIADLNQDILSADIYKMLNRYRPIDLRPMGGEAHFMRTEKKMTQANWFRAKEPLPDNQALHRGVLAYSTDLTLLSTSGRPHDVLWMDEHVVTASIDHSLWVHSDNINANEWLLYVMDTPWSGNSRGLNRGSIFTQEGELVASVAQEGLIRLTK